MNICELCWDFYEGKRCPCRKDEPTGEPHPFANSKKGKKLSKKIKDRDDNECKRCVAFGITDKRIHENLQTHHIKSWRDYPELAYEPNNLICVCQKCNLFLGNSNKLDFHYDFPEMKKPSL